MNPSLSDSKSLALRMRKGLHFLCCLTLTLIFLFPHLRKVIPVDLENRK